MNPHTGTIATIEDWIDENQNEQAVLKLIEKGCLIEVDEEGNEVK